MPTVADVETIAKTLGSILAGKPQRHGADRHPHPGVHADGARVAHLGRGRGPRAHYGGRRRGLRARAPRGQPGDLPLLLLDGEQLVGAKQNWIMNMTVLVAAHTAVTIPVSCVERVRLC